MIQSLRNNDGKIRPKPLERAVLVHVKQKGSKEDPKSELEELSQLCLTAGAEPIRMIVQERDSVEPRSYIGKGKAEEIASLVETEHIDLVVFDSELRPNQLLNLEKLIPAKIVDRTTLILDIFAQRAVSKEGKLQVEMAQLTYMLPRLFGEGTEMSRMAGGIGTRRGPGETKLEVDRRRIYKRLSILKRALGQITNIRREQRKQRQAGDIFNISLVGYTNAGKSTLLKLLTGHETLIEDKLFATLDSKTGRSVKEPHLGIVFSDTVGFISHMPKELEAAFSSTLEEVRHAQLLLHVVNSEHIERDGQIESVERVLEEIGASERPRMLVFNKSDLLSIEEINAIRRRHPDAVIMSGLNGQGVDDLYDRIRSLVLDQWVEASVEISVNEMAALQKVLSQAKVLEHIIVDDVARIKIRVHRSNLGLLDWRWQIASSPSREEEPED